MGNEFANDLVKPFEAIGNGVECIGQTVAAGACAMVGESEEAERLINKAGKNGMNFLENAPVVSDVYDVGAGIAEGDPTRALMGLGGGLLTVATMGAGSVAATGAKTVGKAAAKSAVKSTAKSAVKSTAKTTAKTAAKTTTKATVKSTAKTVAKEVAKTAAELAIEAGIEETKRQLQKEVTILEKRVETEMQSLEQDVKGLRATIKEIESLELLLDGIAYYRAQLRDIFAQSPTLALHASQNVARHGLEAQTKLLQMQCQVPETTSITLQIASVSVQGVKMAGDLAKMLKKTKKRKKTKGKKGKKGGKAGAAFGAACTVADMTIFIKTIEDQKCDLNEQLSEIREQVRKIADHHRQARATLQSMRKANDEYVDALRKMFPDVELNSDDLLVLKVQLKALVVEALSIKRDLSEARAVIACALEGQDGYSESHHSINMRLSGMRVIDEDAYILVLCICFFNDHKHRQEKVSAASIEELFQKEGLEVPTSRVEAIQESWRTRYAMM